MSFFLTESLQSKTDSSVSTRKLSSLSFDRTVPRNLVHRRSVGEVFLTDARRIAADRVQIGAQLPTSHTYFHDHTNLNSLDPLLLMEICRQANIATAHMLEVSYDTTLISQNFCMADISIDVPLGHPLDVGIDSIFEWTKFRRGIPRAGECRQELYIKDRLICRYSGKGILVSSTELDNLRSYDESGVIKSTESLVDVAYPDAIPPYMVGRTNPLNVVLTDLSKNSDKISATISPRMANLALFDHNYDHFTMQIVTEACRQIATFAFLDHHSSIEDSCVLPSIGYISGHFNRFAEISSVVRVSIPRLSVEDFYHSPVSIQVTQSDQIISTVAIQYSRGADKA